MAITIQAGLSALEPSPYLGLTVHDKDRRFYVKGAVAQSMSPQGLRAKGRYRDGLFDKVPGAKARYIGEIGYRGRADLGERSSWYRAGAIYNTSQYQIFDGTGRKGDNHAFYAVADIQLTQSSPAVRQLGWYANLRGNYAPPDRNFYTGDLSAALYKVGTFEARLP